MPADQLSLWSDGLTVDPVVEAMREILNKRVQPSAWEILAALEHKLGLKARWLASEAIRKLIDDLELTNSKRDYLRGLLGSEDWRNALRGVQRPAREIESTIDTLLRESTAYRNSGSFQEMVSFMANFRDYAPFNNMLVKLQNPSCSFYATRRDWDKRFCRSIKEDARPMMILAPMHPVMLVFDLDSTEGPALPEELLKFGEFQGQWDPVRLSRTLTNASHRDLIRIDTRELSSTHAGFATITLNRLLGQEGMKMRIVLHLGLDEPSRYGVLLHELAHIYLGHLGGDADGWWPSRGDLARGAMEVEAEAVAYIVSRRAGLKGASPQYVSRYLNGEEMLKAISLDQTAKVSGRLEEMGTRIMGKRRTSRATTGGIRRR